MSSGDADIRAFRSAVGAHVLVVDGSRIYDLPEVDGPLTDDQLWSAVGLLGSSTPRIDGTPLAPPAVSAISLNVMQACNMSCRYCYADEGRFGGRPRSMGQHVARAAVDRLITDAAPGVDLVLGYMGGEPLLARALVHDTTRYASEAARAAGRRIRFSLTTNLSTLTPDDAHLFAEHPFTVAVSVDGEREGHDAARPMRDGTSSYDRMLAGLAVLAEHGRPRHLAARVTVTPQTGELLPILDHIISLGFDEVGFAAVLVSPDPALRLSTADLPMFLERMTACGRRALTEITAGRPYPFGNFETAMHQIHRGSHRPYPCGAGAAYLSANAEGRLFACHRLIDDPEYAMGSVTDGADDEARSAHLARSHVDRMEPCRSCWARYLCGGGCYHEVSRRGRVGCDYIRGWLDFCLQAYAELSAARPGYFAALPEPSRLSSPTTIAT